jgi:cell pole-organizing protein PopZ
MASVVSLNVAAPAFVSKLASPSLRPAVQEAKPAPEQRKAEPPEPQPEAPRAQQHAPVEPPRRAAEAPEATLLSPASGAKIGAAFDALTETLARDSQLVERLAREMLRPMLKAWLDDNLPVVVERLVRAEIERVARGRSS